MFKNCGTEGIINTYNRNIRKRKGKNRAILEAIMFESFPKLMSDTKPQNQEAQRI